MSKLWDDAIEPYEQAAWGVLIYVGYGLLYVGAFLGWLLCAALATAALALMFFPEALVVLVEVVKEALHELA